MTSLGLSGRSGVGIGFPRSASFAPVKGVPISLTLPQPAASAPSATAAAKLKQSLRVAGMMNGPDCSKASAKPAFRRFCDWP